MKIAIGSDHAGFTLKNQLRDLLRAEGHDVHDHGTETPESSDYPDFAARVGHAVVAGEAERGILCCGTGVGISIAANKIPVMSYHFAWPGYGHIAKTSEGFHYYPSAMVMNL